MRPSRQRHFGQPKLVEWIRAFAAQAREDGWPGLLVGDMAQPRGGPMLTGHASRQLGLEADLWLTPAPAGRLLTPAKREEMSALDMVRPDLLDVDDAHFGESQIALLRRAALMPEVDRLFVNAAIKRPQRVLKLGDLPAACRAVLTAPSMSSIWLHREPAAPRLNGDCP